MGASASVSNTSSTQDIMTKAINSCPQVSVSNTANLGKVIISPPSNCPGGSSFTLSQSAGVDASCVINAAQQAAVNQALQASAVAQAGIGLSASDSQQIINTKIQNIINNNCGDNLAANVINIPEITISACTSNIPQVANAKVACQLQNTQALSSQLQAANTSAASGLSLSLSSLGGIVVIIIILAIIGGLYYYYSQQSTEED